MNKVLVHIVFFFLLFPQLSYGQGNIEVLIFETSPVIDGIIEEDVWSQMRQTSEFTQLEPDRGAAASQRTTVYTGQDRQNIYFAFICSIDDRSEIAARIQRRDQLSDADDLIAVLLDTYNDRRTSLLFMVNPLGTLADAKIVDDGKNSDNNWDTEWEAVVSINDTSWQVEMKIPFKSIQFAPKQSVWGINFGRVIRKNTETVWWSEVTENFRISQGGTLTGVAPKGKQNNGLKFFPYGTVRYEDSDISGVHDKVKGDAGADLQFNLGSNLIANLTYNPDFATVEGDKEQINLTPWELRFPDKRIFFQDGNELFRTRISTFYSRRIGDMQYGGKLIGKAGKYQFNGLMAKTEPNELADQPGAWQNALRVKRDIFRSSIIGLTYADKIQDDQYVRSLSLDYVMNIGKTWKFTGQFVGSAPGDFASHSAWFVRFARENNIYHYHIRYSSFGKNFQDNVNQTGFIPDDDRHELDGDIRYRWWINKFARYIQVEGRNNIFWSQEGVLRSWYFTYGARTYLDNRFSLDLYYNNEYKNEYRNVFKDYYNHFYNIILGYNTEESTNASIGYRKGVNFDRNFDLLSASTRIKIFKNLVLNYEFNWIEYSPDPYNSSTIINVLGMDYFFTPDLWIRIFTQNNSAIEKYYFYGLFGWRFKPPFGAVYLIVSSDQYEEYEPEFNEINSNLVFLKLTYPLTVF